MISEKQLALSRATERQSTGPRTSEGEARVRANARNLGLFVADTVLPQEDPDEFAAALAGCWSRYTPETPIEIKLVKQLALAMFKQERYNRMETGILWSQHVTGTRIAATRELGVVSARKALKQVLRAQAQAARDFNRTYKLLEEIKRKRPNPRQAPAEIKIVANLLHEPRPVLRNEPIQPFEINKRQASSWVPTRTEGR